MVLFIIMTIPEAEHYLPESRSLEHVFGVAKRTHFTIGYSVDEIRKDSFEKVAGATGDFVTTAIGYFSNRGHSELAQVIGTNAWTMIDQHIVLTAYSDNIFDVLSRDFGMHPQEIQERVVTGEPVFLVCEIPKNGQKVEGALMLFPAEFPVRVMTKPVEALATIGYMTSQINDIANNRS